MAELFEQGAAISERAKATVPFAGADDRAVEFMFGVQKIMTDDILAANLDMFDRARIQTHLLTEFVTKMAGSHSVKDLTSMYRECSQHQIDFLRRDCDRLSRHHEWLVEMTSKLVGIYR